MRKYITFRFGDNDFSNPERYALEFMWKEYPDILKEGSFDQIKEMVIRLMVGFMLASYMTRMESDRNEDPIVTLKKYMAYFKDATISDTKEDANYPNNGEWCSVDLYSGYVWSH